MHASGLIGRDDELAAIGRALAADRPVVVIGEAGIGRTTLVRAAVAASGRTLFEGGAFATITWMPNLALERAVGRTLDGDAAWVASVVERIVGPDVLYVDDAQWADAATLDAAARLAGRVALVVATRQGDAGTDRVLAALAGVPHDIVGVSPLPGADGARLAVARRPGLSDERARAIAARAGGNPFVIEELAAFGEPTAGLRRAVRARLDGVGPREMAALRVLCLADRPLPRDAVDGADALLHDGLVVVTADGRVAIRHALLADAVLAESAPHETRDAHLQLARLKDGPGERARHLAAAGERVAAHGVALEAVAAATSPGERAAHLGLAAATASGRAANALRIEAASALRVAADLETAAAVLDELESPDAETLALAEATRARICWSAGDPDGMRAAIDRGLAMASGTGSRAEALLRAEAVTVTALVDGRFEEGLAAAGAAVQLARNANADPTRALLLQATILAGIGRPGWAEALEAVVESARATGDVETELSAANNLVSGHEMHGRPEVARRVATEMLERADALRLASWVRQAGAMIANLDLHAGRLREALARSESLLEEPLDPLATQQVGLVASVALVDLGRHDEAASLLSRLLPAAAPDVTGRGDVLFVLAEAALWSGRPDMALAHLDGYLAYAASEYPTSFLVDVTAGWAAFDAGRPLPARCAIGEAAGMLIGARLEREAIETLPADTTRAATTFDDAAKAYAGFHRRGELRARWAAAEARRRAGAVDEARQALEAVEIDLLGAGFVPLLGRVHRSMRLLGVRRSTRGPSEDLPSRLTARERQIAALVGQGLTNPEIARRLGLGRPTVARLLSNAMLKLGVDSRAQLAARQAELA